MQILKVVHGAIDANKAWKSAPYAVRQLTRF